MSSRRRLTRSELRDRALRRMQVVKHGATVLSLLATAGFGVAAARAFPGRSHSVTRAPAVIAPSSTTRDRRRSSAPRRTKRRAPVATSTSTTATTAAAATTTTATAATTATATAPQPAPTTTVAPVTSGGS